MSEKTPPEQPAEEPNPDQDGVEGAYEDFLRERSEEEAEMLAEFQADLQAEMHAEIRAELEAELRAELNAEIASEGLFEIQDIFNPPTKEAVDEAKAWAVFSSLLSKASSYADLAEPLRTATSAKYLAAILNTALQIDLVENSKRKAKPVSFKLLNYYAFHKGQQRYRTFLIPKRTRGEKREIKAPDNGLMRIQRLLLHCLTAAFTTCDKAAHGFVAGRSVLTNAAPHAGRRYVLNLDLEGFFPNTPVQRVVKVLQLPPFNLKKAVAHLVASLCCDQGSLPQGAPTSPLLTNAVCQRLDRRLRKMARIHRCTYTRYADDLTFSSNRPAFRQEFHDELNAILTAEGYRQNPNKQRLLTPSQRQEVTGVVVNERPNVPREYVRQIRAMLHNWETKGYEAASATSRKHYGASKAHARHKGGIPKLERVLAGKIAYLGMIQGKDSLAYTTCYQKLKSLSFDKDNSVIQNILTILMEKGIKEVIASKLL